MITNSYRILPSTLDGQKVYRVDTNQNRTADESDPVLIHQTEDGWKPVTQLDKGVDRFSVEQDYGYWRDREVSHKEGWPWNRHKVVDRPLDGKIQPDEISSNGFRRLYSSAGGYSNTFELGGEITKDDQGRFYLQEQYQRYGPYTIITQSEIKQMEAYRADDKNWNVATK